MSILFASGIDNGCPIIPGRGRVDVMDACGHYARWEQDFELARELGVQALRYGPAYHRSHVGPDRFDWDPCDEPMRRLRDLGIETIATLCRFGVPSWLGGFQDPAFPVLFAEYARAFARRYPWVRYFTPVDQIAHTARRSALDGAWNEGDRSDAAFVRATVNMCLAHELAVDAIMAERPDAIIVQVERVEPVVAPEGEGASARPCDRGEWERAIPHLALDLVLGRESPAVLRCAAEHGVATNDLRFLREPRAEGRRWLGVALPASHGASGGASGARRAIAEHHRRYHLPVLIAEAGHAGDGAGEALCALWDDVQALRAAGVDLRGLGWFPLTDRALHEAEQDARHGAAPRVLAGLADRERGVTGVGEIFEELVWGWAQPAREGEGAPEAVERAG
ncbi:MAG TPA: family 1 glycosylhydrolase [Gemmatimonadaceae bacterium]|nr:family 1 glycosylhydrolase [Gemmatimonadaceae bacterium]